jgi:hypothetical protein
MANFKDGVSKEQMDKLGEKALYSGKTEEQKWKVIWEIIFVTEELVPSACKLYTATMFPF